MTPLIQVEKLSFEDYGFILCYPRPSLEEFNRRILELKSLGVETLDFSGGKKVGDFQVLGKGTSAIIIKAFKDGKCYALKIRRIDSGKPNMRHEAELTKSANNVGVGPILEASTENILLMEFVEGESFIDWLWKLGENQENKISLLAFLHRLFRQCRILDLAGIDHGELSRASKHIIVQRTLEPCILDFEKASLKRRVANVTSIAQFLFLKGKVAEKIQKILGRKDESMIIRRLRSYKNSFSEDDFQLMLNLLLG
jgi:putative serine/threonine protein kinase